MPAFTDKRGDEWTVALDINVLRRVRNTLDVNLCDRIVLGRGGDDDEPLLERLRDDPVLLVDLLYVLCRPQCEDRGISDEGFAAIFHGPSIEAATRALLEALDDFFQSPASKLTLAFETKREERAKTAGEAIASLTDEDWDQLMNHAVRLAASRYGLPSSSSPDSSAATSAAGPPANSPPPRADASGTI